MYQRIRNLLFHTLVPAVLAVLILPMAAFAQEASCTVSIPAEVRVTGSRVPAGTEYKLVLEGITDHAPMPETASLIIKDGGKASFGPIVYTVPGDYQYRISQKSEAKGYFVYDENTYIVTVRVVNAQGGGLAAEIWAVSDSSGDKKAEDIVFTNRYTKSGGGGSTGGGGDHSGGGSSSGGPSGSVTEGPGGAGPSDPGTPSGVLEPAEEDPGMSLIGGLAKTGDTTNLALWMILITASAGAIAVLIVLKKRRDSEE